MKPGGFLILSFPNRASVLRKLERWIHRNASFFKRLGLFKKITRPESYLNVQQWQFTLPEISGLLASSQFEVRNRFYHVAPRALGGLENHPAVGMTVIVEFVRTASS